MNNRKYFAVSLLLLIAGIAFLAVGIYCTHSLPSGLLEAKTIKEEFLLGGAMFGFMLGAFGIVGAVIMAVEGIMTED